MSCESEASVETSRRPPTSPFVHFTTAVIVAEETFAETRCKNLLNKLSLQETIK